MSRGALAGIAIAALLGACVSAAGDQATTPSSGARSEPAADTTDSFQNHRVHQAAQVRIWVPDRWRVDDRTDNVLVLADPDDEVQILFVVVDGDDLLAALLRVTEGVLDEVDDVRLTGDPQPADLHGMEALIQDGTGVVDGVGVDLSVGVVATPADKYLLIVGLAESGSLARHADTLLAILNGLQPYHG